MTLIIDVMSVVQGIAKCLLHHNGRRIPFDMDCHMPSGLPMDRECFTRCLQDRAAYVLHRTAHEPHDARLVGAYSLDVTVPDETPLPAPQVARRGDVFTIGVFPHTHHLLVRFGNREVMVYPNKHGMASVAGISGPATVTAVSASGALSPEVQVP